MDLRSFAARVWEAGRLYARDLPWRYLDDPYAVLVSEVMLQQTQVARVLERWPRFMGMFPTVDSLAAADQATVLGEWQGLGYNRRALLLKRAADRCASELGGGMPDTYEGLLALPGVGPATAAGVVAFAYDSPCVYLETNVRAVFLHEFFPGRDGVPDKEIVPLVRQTCPASGAREWYYALLDYGAHLKATLPNPSRRSAHYVRQGAFEGSRRQKRAELLRIVLASERVKASEVKDALDAFELARGRGRVDDALFESLAAELSREGFFSYEGGVLSTRGGGVL